MSVILNVSDIDHLERAVAIARPDLSSDYDNTVRPRQGVVCRRSTAAHNACKAADTANERIVAGIKEIDRRIRARCPQVRRIPGASENVPNS